MTSRCDLLYGVSYKLFNECGNYMHKLIYAHGTDFHKTHYSSAIFYQALLNFIVIIIRRQLELDRPLIFV